MKTPISFRSHARRVILSVVASFALLFIMSQSAFAMGWNGIEPMKSRRADVERILGRPLADQPGQEGTLHFKVNGGVVTISFVTARLVANKKLNPDYEGTVLEIVLQHDKSSDTPETLTISGNSKFDRKGAKGGEVYSNLKDGIIYTFVEGRLTTTRFTPAATQWARARKG
ncbi:MAG: hypothetical protein M3362_09125 [Acidobacteriota bacterium]|nr:hypothetical protein [Acidobacteriota bacterium]